MHEHSEHVNELVIVRHGESLQNTAKKVGRYLASPLGLPDHQIPLSPKGENQAREVGRRLVALGSFDYYFDSSYERAVKTLNLILEAFPESERDETKRRSHIDLREREPGYNFNMTMTEVNQHFPWYLEYEATVGKFYETPPGGESIAHVCSRVHMFLNSLRRARSGQRVLIVTHGRVMLGFRYWLEKMKVSEVEKLFEKKHEIPNCDVLHYVRDEKKRRFVPQPFPKAASSEEKRA